MSDKLQRLIAEQRRKQYPQDFAPKEAKRSKYGAVATVVDGIRFASKKEAQRYSDLCIMHQAGEVLWFCRQPRFVIEGGEYVADFIVLYRCGALIVEDVKGMLTPVYRRSKRQMKERYEIDIQEI